MIKDSCDSRTQQLLSLLSWASLLMRLPKLQSFLFGPETCLNKRSLAERSTELEVKLADDPTTFTPGMGTKHHPETLLAQL